MTRGPCEFFTAEFITMRTPKDIDERFWNLVILEDKIFPENGCMLWSASCTGKAGYGKFTIESKRIAAHRWNYEQRYGPIAKGLQLDHLCGIRHCVNPDHLEPVTAKRNINRGRRFNAEKTHCIHGHEFNSENTYWWKEERYCRTCRRIRKRKT
jgi:hypothetical protein